MVAAATYYVSGLRPVFAGCNTQAILQPAAITIDRAAPPNLFSPGWTTKSFFAGLHDPGRVGVREVDEFVLLEVERDLGGGGFGRVAAVHEVECLTRAEIAADGAGFGFEAKGLSHQLTAHGDRAGPSDD